MTLPDSSTCDRRLALMQLSDSFFPSGSFTLSHGLEALVQTGQVRSPEDVQTYLRVLLHNKVGSSDLVALLVAYRASVSGDLDRVRHADEMLFAYTPIESAREAQKKGGRALLMVAQSTWPNAQLDILQADILHQRIQGLHPVIFAVVARAAGLEEEDTLFAFLHSWLTGLAGVGIRLGVLGHLNAQRVLKSLAPDLDETVQKVGDRPLNAMWSCTPTIDIAQMAHARLPQRLFTN